MTRALIVSIIALAACSTVSAEPASTIEVLKDGLKIDGTVFSTTSALGHYERVLGKADRTERKANTIYTFDDDGISLYTGSIFIESIVVLFTDDPPYSFSPKQPFEGKLVIGETAIGKDTTKKAIAAIPGVEVESPTDTLTRATYGSVSMLMKHSGSKLESISISWKK